MQPGYNNGMIYATVSQVYVKNGINYLKLTRNDNGVEFSDVSILTSCGDGAFIPSVGDRVIIDIDTQNPTCTFLMFDKDNPPPMQATRNNSVTKIKRKAGLEIEFDERDNNERVTIQTDKKDKVLVDQSKRKFLLKSSDGNTKIEMDCNAGTLKISASKKIEISVGPNKSIEIDNQGIKINGSMSVKVEASTVDINARAQAKMQGSIVTVKGNMQTSVG